MKHTIITLTLLLCATLSFAQELKVKSFELVSNDIIARTSPRNDRNGTPCAVIRVGIALQGVVFDGNTIGEPVYNTGEYLVYVPEGNRQITIRHNSFVPLTVVFADYGIDRVKSSTTYRLTVLTGGVTPSNQQPVGNFLVMNVTPATARVSIDNGEARPVSANGTLKVFLQNGSHSYKVEAEGYLANNGYVNMSGSRQQISVSLQSTKATLAVKTTTSGSKIYIDEDYKGTDSWQGELTPGTYLVEARKDGFRSVSKTVTLAKQQTESITLPSLQQIYGSMMVDYEPVDADVYLDNTLLGKTPNVFTNLAAGKHNIKITKAGYADYTGSVNIQENQQASVSGSLIKGSTVASNTPEINNRISSKTEELAFSEKEVDLGLPSGTIWAGWNIGATSAEKKGNLFAWGETKPKKLFDSDKYFDSRYVKFSLESNKVNIIGTRYDAATIYWGDEWGMPTQKQVNELIVSCEWKWGKYKGCEGMIGRGPNGSSIFFPTTGYGNENDIWYRDSQADYWIGELCNPDIHDHSNYHPEVIVDALQSERAYIFDFSASSSKPFSGCGKRYYGRAIRAVKIRGSRGEAPLTH